MGTVYWVEVEGKITRDEPDENVIFFDDGDTEVSLPKSQVQRIEDGIIKIPEWLAIDRELI